MAERMSTSVLILLLLLNSSAGIMTASGLSDAMGVQPNPGMDSQMDDAISNAKNAFDPGSGTVDTLFGMFAAALNAFNLIIGAVFAAPTMFMNLGLPAWFVVPVFAPMYVVVALDVIYIGTGRSA